MRRTPT